MHVFATVCWPSQVWKESAENGSKPGRGECRKDDWEKLAHIDGIRDEGQTCLVYVVESNDPKGGKYKEQVVDVLKKMSDDHPDVDALRAHTGAYALCYML